MYRSQSTTTAVHSHSSQSHNPNGFLRLVGSYSQSASNGPGNQSSSSSSISSSSSGSSRSSLSSSSSYFSIVPPKRSNVVSTQHTSFDTTPGSPAWYVRPSPTKGRIWTYLERKYYQYEVTWGPYVLTPGEKFIINSLVIIIFSLLAYGLSKVLLLRQIAGLSMRFLRAAIKESGITVSEINHQFLDNALNWVQGAEALGSGTQKAAAEAVLPTGTS